MTCNDEREKDTEEIVADCNIQRYTFTDAFESLLSRTPENSLELLPSTVLSPIVQAYILETKNLSAIKKTELFRRLDFSEFIASHAEDFFFSERKFLREWNGAEDDGYGETTPSSPDCVSLVKMGSALKVVEWNTILRRCCTSADFSQYVRLLTEISPEISIDDLLVSSLDFTALCCDGRARTDLRNGRSTHSYYVTLCWIYNLLCYKRFKRSILRLIFDRLVYFDTEDRFLVIRILGAIIERYAELDALIEEISTRTDDSPLPNHFQDGPVSVDIIKCEADPLLPDLIHVRGPILLSQLDGGELGCDNTYVLVSMLWDELCAVFEYSDLYDSDTKREAAVVLVRMIEKTGKFLWRRMKEKKQILARIPVCHAEMLRAMILSFEDLDDFAPEVYKLLASAGKIDFLDSSCLATLRKHSPKLYLKLLSLRDEN